MRQIPTDGDNRATQHEVRAVYGGRLITDLDGAGANVSFLDIIRAKEALRSGRS